VGSKFRAFRGTKPVGKKYKSYIYFILLKGGRFKKNLQLISYHDDHEVTAAMKTQLME